MVEFTSTTGNIDITQECIYQFRCVWAAIWGRRDLGLKEEVPEGAPLCCVECCFSLYHLHWTKGASQVRAGLLNQSKSLYVSSGDAVPADSFIEDDRCHQRVKKLIKTRVSSADWVSFVLSYYVFYSCYTVFAFFQHPLGCWATVYAACTLQK